MLLITAVRKQTLTERLLFIIHKGQTRCFHLSSMLGLVVKRGDQSCALVSFTLLTEVKAANWLYEHDSN